MYVLTLISPVQQTDFDDAVRHAHEMANIENRHVLANGKAVDWIVREALPKAELDAIRTVHRIDIIQQTFAGRAKKLFMADMDSTIIDAETLDEMAARTGLKDRITAITERAMRGELDFEQALTERVAMLEGLNETVIQETLDTVKVNQGAENLLRTLKANGVTCVLISGGFTQFTGAIAARLGFDAHFGNSLVIENSKLTGKVQKPVLDKAFKKNTLLDFKTRLDLQEHEICAIGDGANDLPMLQAAGLGIGYYPKPLLADALDNLIRHTDLETVRYALGLDC